jgi:hypothetical protein
MDKALPTMESSFLEAPADTAGSGIQWPKNAINPHWSGVRRAKQLMKKY